jgi:hypothetical protein
VEALETVPLLSKALGEALVNAPVTTALASLISGELPLDDWVAVVRTTVPPPPRWRPPVRRGFWRQLLARLRTLFARNRGNGHEIFTGDETVGGTLGDDHKREESHDAADHREGGSTDRPGGRSGAAERAG